MHIILRIADEQACLDGRISYTSETVAVNCEYIAVAHGHQEHTHILMANSLEVIAAETIEQVINSIEIAQEQAGAIVRGEL